MQIQLRTSDTARRMTERYDHIAPDWPHHKRLKAQAVMYGYESWEDLVSSCRPDAPDIPFDQDLDRPSREARWLEMATAVAKAFTIELPYALLLVRVVMPTCDRRRSWPAWYEPNDTFDAAQSRESGLWWCHIGEHGHPFVPPGFVLNQACDNAELCAQRLSDPNGLKRSLRTKKIWVLVPEVGVETGGIQAVHNYFRRGQLLEIEPIPMADYLRAPGKHAQLLNEFFEVAYPEIGLTEQKALMTEWRNALESLHVAAGLSGRSRRRWVQPTVSTRREAGKPWYWPLRLRPCGEALEKAHGYAEYVDKDIRDHFGCDPGYIEIAPLP